MPAITTAFLFLTGLRLFVSISLLRNVCEILVVHLPRKQCLRNAYASPAVSNPPQNTNKILFIVKTRVRGTMRLTKS